MRVRALRGVCIGPGRHLTAGEIADLEPAQVQFLASISAVEPAPEEPAPPVVDEAPESKPKAAKAAKEK